MFPKSNVKVKPGDFCFVRREDGRVALFIYLCARLRSRSYFYGALADAVLEAPEVDLIPDQVSVGEHALLHIKCFRENGTPIVGNMLKHLESRLLADVERQVSDMNVGATHRVWGYRTIVKRANELVA